MGKYVDINNLVLDYSGLVYIYPDDGSEVAKYFLKQIRRQTTDDVVKIRHGHWIDNGWTGDWQYCLDGRGNCWRDIICSECNKSVKHEYNYCPHCGALMDGECKKVGCGKE